VPAKVSTLLLIYFGWTTTLSLNDQSSVLKAKSSNAKEVFERAALTRYIVIAQFSILKWQPQ